MSRPVKNLKRRRFGSLKVVAFIKVVRGNGGLWKCVCDCSNIREAFTYQLVSKQVRMCRKCASIIRQRYAALARSYIRKKPKNREFHLLFSKLTEPEKLEVLEMINRRRRVGAEVTEKTLLHCVKAVRPRLDC